MRHKMINVLNPRAYALRKDLVRSMNASDLPETRFLAETLASLGREAIPMLVSALEEGMKVIPVEGSGDRFGPVFQALTVLDSGAGIPAALALIERAKWMNKPAGFGSAMDYLRDRPDPEVLPAIEAFLERKLLRGG